MGAMPAVCPPSDRDVAADLAQGAAVVTSLEAEAAGICVIPCRDLPRPPAPVVPVVPDGLAQGAAVIGRPVWGFAENPLVTWGGSLWVPSLACAVGGVLNG